MQCVSFAIADYKNKLTATGENTQEVTTQIQSMWNH